MAKGKSAQRELSARAHDRAAKLAAERSEQRRRARTQRVALSGGVLVAVLIVLVTLVVAKLNAPKPTTAASSASAPASVVKAVTGIKAATFDSVGAGQVSNPLKKVAASNGGTAKPPSLTSGGKPRFLYAGAEYCPYCAVERWGVVAALSRFGTWSKLGATTSSASDQPASIATLSFHGAGYTSTYLAFTGVEMQSNQLNTAGNAYATLDKLSSGDQKIFDTYNSPPYVAKANQGAIPFLDIGGEYISAGASTSNATIFSGLTRAQIAAKLAKATDPITVAVAGTANNISAAICQTTGGKPATVCDSSGVKAAAAKLK